MAQSQQRTSAPTFLVFDGVTVVDVEQGKLVPAQRVVIGGNRIEAVGDASKIKAPKGAQVVLAQGKYLIPGLWDMHVHTLDPWADILSYPLLIANGVTGIRDAKSPGVSLATMVEWWKGILAGTLVGPPRQLLAGEGSINEISKEEIAERKTNGANFLKVYPFSFELAAAARRVGLPFGGHVPHEISAVDASDSGISIIDHVGSAGGDVDHFCWNYYWREAALERCRPLAEHLRKNNTWVTPTLSVIALGVVGHFTVDSVRARLAETAAQFWSGEAYRPNWLHGAARPDGADSLPFLSIAHRAGLPILAATDALTSMWDKLPWGFTLHAELATYVAEGLTPLEALQSATLNPAKMLRATDSLGTVAPGKLADLVLLDADPLEDITNTTTVHAVVANGRYFDRAALDSLLVEVRARRPQ